MTSNFAFLRAEWPEFYDAASRSEELVHPDARAACFYARRALELTVAWLYRNDAALKLPYHDHLSASASRPSRRPSARRFSTRRKSSRTWATGPFAAPGRCAGAQTHNTEVCSRLYNTCPAGGDAGGVYLAPC